MADPSDDSQQGSSSGTRRPENQAFRLQQLIDKEEARQEPAASAAWKPSLPPFHDSSGYLRELVKKNEKLAAERLSRGSRSKTPLRRKRDTKELLQEDSGRPSGSCSPVLSGPEATATAEEERHKKSPRSASQTPTPFQLPLGSDGVVPDLVLEGTGPGMEHESVNESVECDDL